MITSLPAPSASRAPPGQIPARHLARQNSKRHAPRGPRRRLRVLRLMAAYHVAPLANRRNSPYGPVFGPNRPQFKWAAPGGARRPRTLAGLLLGHFTSPSRLLARPSWLLPATVFTRTSLPDPTGPGFLVVPFRSSTRQSRVFPTTGE